MELSRLLARRRPRDRRAVPAAARRTNFVDEAVVAQLDRDGFAVLRQRLALDQVAELAALYGGVMDMVGRDASGAFLPSMMIRQADHRARLWDGVRDIVAADLGPLFAPGSTEILGGSFVSKPGSEHSVRNPHQDPSVFDEARHVSISIWIPLTDAHAGNGTLRVLPGSHRMGNHIRPPDVESFDDEVSAIARERSAVVEVEAGAMLVIDGAAIHHSPPNTSGEERVAAICAVRPEGAAMSLVRSAGGAVAGVADIYDVSVDVFRCGDLVDPVLDPAALVGRQPYRPATVADLERSFAGG